jgi:hypothetical protein
MLWRAGAKNQAERYATEASLALHQSWDREATVYQLDDGSRIYSSGQEFRVGTIADIYVGAHFHNVPADVFYADKIEARLVRDTSTSDTYEFNDGSQVDIDVDGYVTAPLARDWTGHPLVK